MAPVPESFLADQVNKMMQNPPRIASPSHDTIDAENPLAHPHSAMQCARKIYYSMTIPAEGNANMPVITGTVIHQYLIDSLINEDFRNNGERKLAGNIPIDLRPKWPVIGEADLMDDTEVMDLKTTSSTGLYYRKHENTAAINHIVQCGIYALALEREKIGILYISREKFNTVYYQYNLADYLKTIYTELDRLTYLTTIRSRPRRLRSDGKELNPFADWECHYCGYRSQCLKGEEINWLPKENQNRGNLTIGEVVQAPAVSEIPVRIEHPSQKRTIVAKYPPLPRFHRKK